MVHSALCTIDRSDIFATIAELRQNGVKVSVISMAGEMYVSSRISLDTRGTFTVTSSAVELRNALFRHTECPPSGKDDAKSVDMVRWGFPKRAAAPGLCACHLLQCEAG
jgi:hypothetical protein